MVPGNHSAGLFFFIFNLKHRPFAKIDTDGQGEVVRNSSPGLYHTPSLILLFLSSTCEHGLTRKKLTGYAPDFNEKLEELSQGWVVQTYVKFNTGLSKKYSSNWFSKENIAVCIKCCSDFLRKKLYNPKFTAQIHLCKVGNKNHGLTI